MKPYNILLQSTFLFTLCGLSTAEDSDVDCIEGRTLINVQPILFINGPETSETTITQ